MTLQAAFGDGPHTASVPSWYDQWGRNWIPTAPKTVTKTVTVEEYDKDGKMVKKTITTTTETETPPAIAPYPSPTPTRPYPTYPNSTPQYPYTINYDYTLG